MYIQIRTYVYMCASTYEEPRASIVAGPYIVFIANLSFAIVGSLFGVTCLVPLHSIIINGLRKLSNNIIFSKQSAKVYNSTSQPPGICLDGNAFLTLPLLSGPAGEKAEPKWCVNGGKLYQYLRNMTAH